MNALRANIIQALFCCTIAAYPSTFPFQNEAYVPPDLNPSTPSNSYDDSDPGGYLYYYTPTFRFSLTEANFLEDFQGTDISGFGYAAQTNGCTQHALVVTFGAPPVLSVAFWNCTANGLFFADGDFTGVIGSQTVCSVGECCSELIGFNKYGSDQMDQHAWLDDKASTSMCSDIPEAVYCVMVGGDFQINCYNPYVSVTERGLNLPCFDSFTLYYLDCSVLKTTGTQMKFNAEPLGYLAEGTPEQNLAAEAIFYLQDRVCSPYSYYFPSTSTSSSSTSSTSSSSSSSTDSSSSSTDSSSGNAYKIVFAFFLAFV